LPTSNITVSTFQQFLERASRRAQVLFSPVSWLLQSPLRHPVGNSTIPPTSH
jgi:hypothetical protein